MNTPRIKTDEEWNQWFNEKMVKSATERLIENNERIATLNAFLNANYKPKNHIEKALQTKMTEFAHAELAWLAGDMKEELSSEPYDIWLNNFFTSCGMPKDNTAELSYNINEPYPQNEFCRDWYAMKFLDITVDALIELSNALLDGFDTDPEPDEENDLISELIDLDDDDNLNTLTPVEDHNDFFQKEPKVKKLVMSLAKQKKLNKQLLAVLALSAFENQKSCFLLSKTPFSKLLKAQNLIDSKTISGTDFKKFTAFVFQSKLLKIEVDRDFSEKKSRLVSLDGTLADFWNLVMYDNLEDSVKHIKSKYLDSESARKPIVKTNAQTPQENRPTAKVIEKTTTDDVELCNRAMLLSDRFNEIDKEKIPSIAKLVAKFGSFKSEEQRNVIVNFLKNKGVRL